MLTRSLRRVPALGVRAIATDVSKIERTALYDFHTERLNGKMVEYAGYSMPVLYEGPESGVKNEHLNTRRSCGVFDVSHMG